MQENEKFFDLGDLVAGLISADGEHCDPGCKFFDDEYHESCCIWKTEPVADGDGWVRHPDCINYVGVTPGGTHE